MTEQTLRRIISTHWQTTGKMPESVVLPISDAHELIADAIATSGQFKRDVAGRIAEFSQAMFHPTEASTARYNGVQIRAEERPDILLDGQPV